MNRDLKQRGVLAFCLLAGLTDAGSGLLLMLLPEFTLGVMQVGAVAAEALVFIRFIGAFVFSVGCLYLFALLPVLRRGRWSAVRFVFLATAWVRLVIGLFTGLAIVGGALSLHWISVPLTDGLLAVFQLGVVWKAWMVTNEV